MKKPFIFITACLILLTGCGSDIPAVNLPPQDQNSAQTAAVIANDEAADVPSADALPENDGNGAPTAILPDSAPPAVPSEAGGVKNANNHAETPVAAPSGKVVEIREKLFVAQTNDIYYNPEDYLGKTIKYEGIFYVYEDSESGATYYSVIRYGPGCCGIDKYAGFEVRWEQDYPRHDDWVEVAGVLEEYEEDGGKYLRLAVTSLTVLPTRGEEYVSQ
ncbi:MAG: hypothetical protein LBT22_01320 [Peptococcaceae bacterium]|jgi:hypothetical protein|nr:hypothetical protein [Peptococcaceae bacterium]